MRLLLDTNALLWWRDASPRLPTGMSARIRDPDNDIFVSIISWWEIAIKRTLRRLQFLDDFEHVMDEEGFTLLSLSYGHLRILSDLPLHHRDPFDRLLIAQALAERIPVVTNDESFSAYGVETLW